MVAGIGIDGADGRFKQEPTPPITVQRAFTQFERLFDVTPVLCCDARAYRHSMESNEKCTPFRPQHIKHTDYTEC